MYLFEYLVIASVIFLTFIGLYRPKSLLGKTRETIIQLKKKPIKKLHEKKCREIIENYYKKPFPCVRPDFLKYKNKNLELDMYNDELKLAFEYDGIQHAQYNKHFHKNDYNNFIKQKERDAAKNDLCRKNGIKLIRIPHTIKYENLEKELLSFIKGMN